MVLRDPRMVHMSRGIIWFTGHCPVCGRKLLAVLWLSEPLTPPLGHCGQTIQWFHVAPIDHPIARGYVNDRSEIIGDTGT